jgi:hypothetical protein
VFTDGIVGDEGPGAGRVGCDERTGRADVDAGWEAGALSGVPCNCLGEPTKLASANMPPCFEGMLMGEADVAGGDSAISTIDRTIAVYDQEAKIFQVIDSHK